MRVPMRRADIVRAQFLKLAKRAASVIARGAFRGSADKEALKEFLKRAPRVLKNSISLTLSSFIHENEKRYNPRSFGWLLDNLRRFPNFDRELGIAFVEWVIRRCTLESEVRHFYFLCTRPDLPARKRPLIWHMTEAYRRNG